MQPKVIWERKLKRFPIHLKVIVFGRFILDNSFLVQKNNNLSSSKILKAYFGIRLLCFNFHRSSRYLILSQDIRSQSAISENLVRSCVRNVPKLITTSIQGLHVWSTKGEKEQIIYEICGKHIFLIIYLFTFYLFIWQIYINV